ncbi:MAG TPA: SLBB domain-containing protein [Terracidiphilus sp.]|jgi:polysaccharide export outer membrane protein
MKVVNTSIVLMALVTVTTSGRPLSAQIAADDMNAPHSAEPGAILIGSGDLLDLSVYDVPELIVKVQVSSTGYVSLPLIGDLKLAGLTVRDAQGKIANILMSRELVKKPEVTILIEQAATQGIKVLGEVNTPGVYPLLGPHKLSDAIAAAGGLTLQAGQTIIVQRAAGDRGSETYRLSGVGLSDIPEVPIYPGDTVSVSKAGVVYVMGEVQKPGAFQIQNGSPVTILKALSMAGGTTKLASMKRAVIVRHSADGTEIEMDVSLKALYAGHVADLSLHSEDILYVPLSNIKNYGLMGLAGAIQAAVETIYAVQLR